MVKTIFLIIIISSCLFAQNNSIRLNPGTILTDNSIELLYERKVIEKHGIQLNASIGEVFDSDNRSLRIGLSYTRYFKEMFKRFYIFPGVSISFRKNVDEQYTDSEMRGYNDFEFGGLENNAENKDYFDEITIEPGIGIGYRWVLFNRLTCSIGGGAGPCFELRRYFNTPVRKLYVFLISDVGYVF